ncbi:uncharacterized protein [Henckelia pumila]|uniref:uncharacterized protein n=1 Tax=Henckelia pumila TaxID=405737 RepID=UPI003C6EA38A
MLIVFTLDANNQVLPLAFTIIDEETSDLWKWFLENFGRHVVCGKMVCLISDRQKGIVRAFEDLPYFKPPHGVHRFCLRHICSNFNVRFKDVHLKDLCWEAGKQHQICKFDATMEEINNKNILAHGYLAGISKEKWSMAHDGGWCRGVMTTNMSECLNSVLKGVRRLPISAIVHLSLLRCVQYMYFIERITKGQRMVATGGRPSHGQHMQVVKLSTTDCSCDKWTIFGISCFHAICTAKWHSLDPTTLVQSCYNISEYLTVYEGRFEYLEDERYWDQPNFELQHNSIRRERRIVGRDTTTQLRNEMDRPVKPRFSRASVYYVDQVAAS